MGRELRQAKARHLEPPIVLNQLQTDLHERSEHGSLVQDLSFHVSVLSSLVGWRRPELHLWVCL